MRAEEHGISSSSCSCKGYCSSMHGVNEQLQEQNQQNLQQNHEKHHRAARVPSQSSPPRSSAAAAGTGSANGNDKAFQNSQYDNLYMQFSSAFIRQDLVAFRDLLEDTLRELKDAHREKAAAAAGTAADADADGKSHSEATAEQEQQLQQLQQAQKISTLKKELSNAKQTNESLRGRKQLLQQRDQQLQQRDQQLQQRDQQLQQLRQQLQKQQHELQQHNSPALDGQQQQLQSVETTSSSCSCSGMEHNTVSTASTTMSSSSSTAESEGRSKKRKTYSESDKTYIIRADENDGRQAAMVLADQIGMPRKTARNLLVRYKNKGDSVVHDKRFDTGVPARNTKREAWHVDIICDWLRWDATITLKALLEMLNVEIGRRILCEERDKKCATCLHLLAEEERMPGHPLDVHDRMRDACDEAKETFAKKFIHDERTIRSWLYDKPVCYSRKAVVEQKSSANTAENMRKRLEFAKVLDGCIRSANDYYLLFMDEMPFYSTMSCTKGRSRKGERAVVLLPPESSTTNRLQAAMTVNPEHGLIYGQTFAPVRRSRSWSAQYGRDEFKKYLYGLFETLMYEGNRRINVKYAEAIRNKHIKLIWDNAPDHGSRIKAADTEHGIPESVKPENFDEFVSFAQERGATVQIVFAAPISPHLNLCEFYNRVLRIYANAERTESEVRTALLQARPRGQTIENRVSMLEEIVRGGMQKLKYERGPLNGSMYTLKNTMQKVMENDGYLDWHWIN